MPGVFGTGLAYVIMGTLVGRVGSTRASFITYVIPVVAVRILLSLSIACCTCREKRSQY